MTVKFYTNFSDYDGTRTGTLSELFDPRINQMHGANEDDDVNFSDVCVSDWERQISVVYSIESIQAHTRWFFNGHSETTSALRVLLNNLKDRNSLHYAAFVYVGYAGDIYGYVPGGTWDSKRLTRQGNNSNLDLTKVTEWFDKIQDFFADELDDPLSDHINDRCVDLGNVATKLARMMTGRNYAYLSNRSCWGSVTDLLGLQSFGIQCDNQFPDVTVTDLVERPGLVRRDRLYRVLSYSARATNEIAPQILHTKKDKNGKEQPTTKGELLYGIELELATDHSVRTLIDSQEFPFFITKQDSSISGRGDTYVECVTVPMDYRGQRKAWGKFFGKFWDEKEAKYNGFDTSTQTTNGMHIHMTKSAFQDFHLKKFCWMICKPEHRDFITYLSERGSTLGSYATMPTFTPSQNTNKKKFDSLLSRLPNRGAVSLSTSSGRTIEVRLFKGIVSYATLVKNLEFCDALYYYTLVMPYSKLNLQDFIRWINFEMSDSKPGRNYKALRLFIKKIPPSIFNLATVRSKIESAKSAEELIDILNREQIETDEKIQTIIATRLGQLGEYSQKVYYGREGWTKTVNLTKAKLCDNEAELNPFVKRKAA